MDSSTENSLVMYANNISAKLCDYSNILSANYNPSNIFSLEYNPRSNVPVAIQCDKNNPFNYNLYITPSIKKVIFDDPYTTVIWSDNNRTTVKCIDGNFSEELGLAFAITRKFMELGYRYPRSEFKKCIKNAKRYNNHTKNKKPKTVKNVVTGFTSEQIKVVEALIQNAVAPNELRSDGFNIGDMPIEELDNYLESITKKLHNKDIENEKAIEKHDKKTKE